MSYKKYHILGLMSGTSMDGIDAAIIETDGENEIYPIASLSLEYSRSFKLLLKATEYSYHLNKGKIEISTYDFEHDLFLFLRNFLNFSESDAAQLYLGLLKELGIKTDSQQKITIEHVVTHSTLKHLELIESLLKKNSMSANELDAIGYHGQTFYHNAAEKISVQQGMPNILAERLKIPVVYQFRQRDIASGGQGAPLAPIFHLALIRHLKLGSTAVVNCGGIANVTYIYDDKPEHMVSLDTGPGNVLLDRFVREKTNGQEFMDCNGHYGSRGSLQDQLLKKLFDEAIKLGNKNYFDLYPPKSLNSFDCCLPDFIKDYSLEDVCKTLAIFTADTIAKSLEYVPNKARFKTWILAGGGWAHPVIFKRFKEQIKNFMGDVELHIYHLDKLGWENKFFEAQLIAYLAARRLRLLPSTFPNTTGTMTACLAGEIIGT